VVGVATDGSVTGALAFTVETNDDQTAEVCRLLVQGGWSVVRLERSQRKLENVFLELVQGRS
jgi:hypothetical protein